MLMGTVSRRSFKKPSKPCADCGHHISVHQYTPCEDGNTKQGPQKCRLCDCLEYRKPGYRETITYKKTER